MSPKLLNILLLLTAGCLYYFVANPLYTGEGDIFRPQGGGIVGLRVEKAKLELASSTVGGIIAAADALKKDYASINDKERANLDVMIPDQIDRMRFMSELTGMIDIIGVPVKELQVTDVRDSANGDLGSYAVSFQIKTTYERFKEMITYFEYDKRLFTMDGVSTAAPKDDENEMTFNVKLRTYYLK